MFIFVVSGNFRGAWIRSDITTMYRLFARVIALEKSQLE